MKIILFVIISFDDVLSIKNVNYRVIFNIEKRLVIDFSLIFLFERKVSNTFFLFFQLFIICFYWYNEITLTFSVQSTTYLQIGQASLDTAELFISLWIQKNINCSCISSIKQRTETFSIFWANKLIVKERKRTYWIIKSDNFETKSILYHCKKSLYIIRDSDQQVRHFRISF